MPPVQVLDGRPPRAPEAGARTRIHAATCPSAAVALQRVGVKPDEAVGDSPYDAEAATRINMRIIRLLCGGLSAKELREAGGCAVDRDQEDRLANFDRSPLATHPARAA